MASRKKAPRFRTEKDTLGKVRVPSDALYGAQTQRAVENFPVSGIRENPVFIHAYVTLKKAAALANHELGALQRKRAKAIVEACNEILGGSQRSFDATVRARKRGSNPSPRDVGDDIRRSADLVPDAYVTPDHLDQFVVDVFQAGAGTSFHMNVNEVLANLANRSLGGEVGAYDPVHPNDHVNFGQSTNDTFPTATRISILLYLRELLPALDDLAAAFERKGREFDDVIKSGRTHLQDAVPVTLGQEFAAWGAALRRSVRLIVEAADELRELGIGGSAAGTGINTAEGYRYVVVEHLSELTGLELESMPDLREAMQSQQPIATISAALRNLALELTRISNDLRLLSSGPLTGLGEIVLPEVQPGSSIMPGKINPSMLECMNQVAFHVIGSDATVAYAVQAGQIELNVMMPLMAYEILFSIEILKNYVPVFTERCISGIEANRERAEEYYITSPALATALNPVIGYAKAAEIAKESARTKRPIPEILREREILSEEEIEQIFTPQFLTGQADK
ncbi:MAG: aspartate ammonia-lyase [Thermoanaerobaculia bacterium]|nr:aspartate ammonia-lyase [Thermoanaerobaculia bacterium]